MSEVEVQDVKASGWNQLSYFKVFVNNDSHLQNSRYPLLNNGNQQLLVTVRLAAKDASGNFVTVTPADLATIRLIDYGTSEIIYLGEQLHPWCTTFTNLGYAWDRGFLDSIRSLRLEQPKLFEQAAIDPPALDQALEGVPLQHHEQAQPGLELHTQNQALSQPGADYQTVQFYVRTTATTLRRLAVRINNSDGTVFRTNYSEVGDDTGEGDKRGKFNSSFEVEPLTFPRLPSENYGDRLANGYLKDTPIGHGDFAGKFRAFEHHVNIRMPNGRSLPIKTITNYSSRNGVVWAAHGSGKSKCTVTYFGLPGSQVTKLTNKPEYIGIMRNGLSREYTGVWLTYLGRHMGIEGKIKYPREGEVVIGQVIMEENFYFYQSVTNNIEVPNRMTHDFSVIDIYGSSHNLRVGLIPAFNYLTLERR